MKLFYSVFISIVVALFIISASIALPIVVRPFYYLQIEDLELEEFSGYSETQIRMAYDEMLDYCLYLTNDFSTGDLAWSESGKSHFDDVRKLFAFDLIVAVTSAVILMLTFIINRIRRTKLRRIFGLSPLFYGGIMPGVIFSVLAVFIAADFNSAFTIFHKLFFPGKDNWIFNPRTDAIINILPEQFFARCALFIGISIIIMCACFIVVSILITRRERLSHNRNHGHL